MATFEEMAATLAEKKNLMKQLSAEIVDLERGLMPLEDAVKDYIESQCKVSIDHVKLFPCSDGSIAPLLYLEDCYRLTIERQLTLGYVKLLGLALNGKWVEAMIEIPERIAAGRPDYD